MTELSRLLGLGNVAEVPGRNNKLVRTIVRAERFGLGFTGVGMPDGATFGIYATWRWFPRGWWNGCPRPPGSATSPPWRLPTSR